MSIESALFTHLTEDAGVSALVGLRVYPQRRPQKGGSLPCIVYTRTGGEHVHHLLGVSGLCRADFDLDCQAETYIEAKALSEAVRNAMDGVRNRTVGGVNIRSMTLQGDSDTDYGPENSSDENVVSVSTEYQIWHVESVPVHH